MGKGLWGAVESVRQASAGTRAREHGGAGLASGDGGSGWTQSTGRGESDITGDRLGVGVSDNPQLQVRASEAQIWAPHAFLLLPATVPLHRLLLLLKSKDDDFVGPKTIQGTQVKHTNRFLRSA